MILCNLILFFVIVGNSEIKKSVKKNYFKFSFILPFKVRPYKAKEVDFEYLKLEDNIIFYNFHLKKFNHLFRKKKKFIISYENNKVICKEAKDEIFLEKDSSVIFHYNDNIENIVELGIYVYKIKCCFENNSPGRYFLNTSNIKYEVINIIKKEEIEKELSEKSIYKFKVKANIGTKNLYIFDKEEEVEVEITRIPIRDAKEDGNGNYI